MNGRCGRQPAMSENTTTEDPCVRLFERPPFASPRQVLSENQDVRDAQRVLVGILEFDSIFHRAEELSQYINHFRYPLDSAKVIMQIMRMASEGDRAGRQLMFTFLASEPGARDVMHLALRPKSTAWAFRQGGTMWEAGTQEASLWKETLETYGVEDSSEFDRSHSTATGLAESDVLRSLRKLLEQGWGLIFPEKELKALSLELSWLGVRSGRVVRKVNPAGRSWVDGVLAMAEKMKLTGRRFLEDPKPDRLMILYEVLGEFEWERILEELKNLPGGEHVDHLLRAQKELALLPWDISSGAGALRSISSSFPDQASAGSLEEINATLILLDNLSRNSVSVSLRGTENLELLHRFASALRIERKDDTLRIDLDSLPGTFLHDNDFVPKLFNVQAEEEKALEGFRTLVFMNLDNDTFLREALRNPKVIAAPGLVAAIALRGRTLGALTYIATSRDCFSGYANKDVPVNLLLNPAKIPLSALRKFVHVRYISRVELQSLANKRGDIRPEIKTEISRYLRSLANK